MMLDDDQKRAHAAALFNDPLFNEIMDGFEKGAINAAIFAGPTDNDLRHASLVEAKAIRNLRTKLKNLAVRSDQTAE